MSTKQRVEQVQSFARNIWLAGLGAYGKGSETVSEKLDKAYEESNQLFNDLVSKGTEIQTSLEAKIKAKTQFEDKVDEVREKLGLNTDVSDAQIDELTAKVEALTVIVTELAQKKLEEAKEEKPARTTRKPRTAKAEQATEEKA